MRWTDVSTNSRSTDGSENKTDDAFNAYIIQRNLASIALQTVQFAECPQDLTEHRVRNMF